MARLLFCIILFAASLVSAAEEPAETSATQTPPPFVSGREFAYRLIQELRLDHGLPKKPKEKDLLPVLSGDRTLAIEAEDVYDPKRDMVTLRNINVFGEFTGKGWISGIAVPTSVTMKVLIPSAGTYKLIIRGVGDGQLWSIGGKALKADCGPKFSDKELGDLFLEAGTLHFNVLLPPDGAVDALRLVAPPLPAIQPLAGWRFDASTTYGDAAELAAVIAAKDLKLPVDKARPSLKLAAVGTVVLPSGASQTTDIVYGRFFGPAWIRNGFVESQLEFPFTVPQTSYYLMKIHWMGKKFSGSLDGKPFSVTAKDYLHWADIETYMLEKGKHELKVVIPPSGGVDGIELVPLASDTRTLLSLLGWKNDPAEQIPRADLERVLKALAARYKPESRL